MLSSFLEKLFFYSRTLFSYKYFTNVILPAFNMHCSLKNELPIFTVQLITIRHYFTHVHLRLNIWGLPIYFSNGHRRTTGGINLLQFSRNFSNVLFSLIRWTISISEFGIPLLKQRRTVIVSCLTSSQRISCEYQEWCISDITPFVGRITT